MKYDFTTIIDRFGKDAAAVDTPSRRTPGVDLYAQFAQTKVEDKFDIIPMWIADMNFSTVPTVPAAMISRAEHPLYGYFNATEAYYKAIIRWQENRNGVTGLLPEDIGYENGVLGGLVSALRVFCSVGENVLVHSPTYIGFTRSIEDNGWNIVLTSLVQDNKGVWRMDYEDMEKKIVDHDIHASVLCSPHNPTGRVWEQWELEKAMDIYKKHHVFVVSDEIWSDIILPGRKHIPTQSISEDARMRTIAMYAPSKTFNLAGLVGSYHIVYNAYLRDRINHQANITHYNNMNVLSMHALIAAYTEEGSRWTDELCKVLDDNLTYAVTYIHDHFQGVKATKPEGTYMLFLNCTDWCAKHGKTIDELQKRGVSVGVIWQDGRPFHGSCHIRLNLALPKSRVKEAFERMDKYVFGV